MWCLRGKINAVYDKDTASINEGSSLLCSGATLCQVTVMTVTLTASVSSDLSEIGKHSTEKHFHICSLCKGFTGWQFGCKVVASSNTTKFGSNPAPSTDVSSGGLRPDIHFFSFSAYIDRNEVLSQAASVGMLIKTIKTKH
jgi:hypothetical protein